MGLPYAILPDLIDPGTELGPLRKSVAEELGIGTPLTVLVPGTHDTASAVAAVPTKGTGTNPPDWCYLSSGTWSLCSAWKFPGRSSTRRHFAITSPMKGAWSARPGS